MLKVLFKKYKGVLQFLLLFSGSYLLLSLVYAGYLGVSVNSAYPPDFITNLVSKQSTLLIESFGYEAAIVPHQAQPSMQLFVNGTYLARIVEGCNAISIIVLFIAFVIAFAQSFKKTVLFIFVGSVLIYAVNILRIAILAIALYNYPEQEHWLHGVLFPALIYGMVFLLWLVWVRMLSPIVTTNE
ncbi:MAG TPA: exosortase family protein XrtF [Flavobacteriaceae bacterium]|nr:exosortase family protein XrtF [Flavobacteriaceae bacterium]HBR55552.1 exosortase family protein XrtF [Flavobacteriaceae bacterium]